MDAVQLAVSIPSVYDTCCGLVADGPLDHSLLPCAIYILIVHHVVSRRNTGLTTDVASRWYKVGSASCEHPQLMRGSSA